MARFGQASICSPECSVRSASSHTTPAQAALRVPFLQRRITNLLSDQTPVPGSAMEFLPGEQADVFASELGASSNLFLMAYNPDESKAGDYSF